MIISNCGGVAVLILNINLQWGQHLGRMKRCQTCIIARILYNIEVEQYIGLLFLIFNRFISQISRDNVKFSNEHRNTFKLCLRSLPFLTQKLYTFD